MHPLSCCNSSNLRIRRGSQQNIADVRYNFRVGVARSGTKFLPLLVAPEGAPALLARLGVLPAEQVGEVGQPAADERLAEKHRRQAGASKDGDFAAIEHFDFFQVRLPAVAFVSAQFEDS